MRRRTAVTTSVAAVLVGSAVAIGVPLAAASGGAAAPASFGSGTATRLAEQPATTAPRATPAAKPTAVPSPAPRAQTRPRSSTAASAPLRLSVAGAGIDAAVVPVGVDASGSVEVPEDVRTVGWYRWSQLPGSSTGSVVVVGHVDSAQQGEGAFYRLHTVRAGQLVAVTASGRTYTYRVVARESYPKSAAPLPAFFARDGAPRLTLITCGGSFDAQNARYSDNVVVTAVPVGVRG